LRAVWIVVLDSDSEVVSSNVFSPEQGSVSAHSRFDLESLTITDWVWWLFEWDSWLGIDGPSLVDTVVALHPKDVVVVGISASIYTQAVSSLSSSSVSVVLDSLSL